MTTDPFTTAARAEANSRTEHWGDERNRRRFLSMFTSGAEWARDHLTAQEPSDAEVEAAARAIALCDRIDFDDLVRRGHGLAGQYRRQARAALSAARAARRDEEKREALAWRMRDWEEVERLQDERRDEEQA